MTGTSDAILKALTREVQERRQRLDDADDVGEVTITVRLTAGTTTIRSVLYQEERVCRSQPMRRPLST